MDGCGCLVISKHFRNVKIGNHPIDSQPFINGWLQGVPGSYFSKGLVQPTSNSMDFFSEAFETSIRRMTCLEDHPRTDLDTDTWFKNWPMMGCVFVFGP